MKTLLTALVCIGISAPAWGQEADKKEEKKAPIEATVSDCKGTVDVKKAGENDWVAAEKGMKLKEGSELCTGYSSSAVLEFTGGVKVDLASLTSLTIDVHAMSGKKADTTIKMNFGQVELDVKKGEIEANVKVATPNSTTSISGTTVMVRSFSDESFRGVPQHAAVRVREGTVQVFNNIVETGMVVTMGEVMTVEAALPQEAERVLLTTSLPPLVGATIEEVGLTTTTAATFETQTIGTLSGELTSSGSTATTERVAAQEAAVLPGPPPPPPPE